MRCALIRAAVTGLLLAPLHTALPVQAARAPRLCRTSTASSTCGCLPSITVPAPVTPSWTRA